MGVRLAWMALVVVLAGCLAPAAREGLDADGVRVVPCDEEGAVCPVELTDASDVAYEPAAAADPRRPGTFAVAATIVAPASERVRGTPPAGSEPNGCVVSVHTTRDGGRTWISSRPPVPPLSAFGEGPFYDVCARSPSVAFAPGGSVYLVASATATTVARAVLSEASWRIPGFTEPEPLPTGLPTRVYALRSEDGGATWSVPEVLRADGNHPYVAFDSSGRGVVTIRLFEGGGFAASEVLFLDSGRRVTLPCHLPTRAVFDGDEALVGCNDHAAMPDAMRLRLYAVPLAGGEPALRGELEVPGAKNLFTALARAPDGTLAFAVTHTIRGGFVDGDLFVATSRDAGRSFSPLANVREVVGPDAENVAWSMIVADDEGRFHLTPVLRRGDDLEALHVVMDSNGGLLAKVVLRAFHDAPAEPADPLERVFPRWRHAAYAGLATEPGAVLVASAWNLERVVEARVARLT